MTEQTRSEASRLLSLGYHVIPLEYKAKRPGYPDWQHLFLSPSDLDVHFPSGKQFNLGVLLGTEVADGVFLHAIDVDFDEPDLLTRVRAALPPCPQKRGRKGFTAFVACRSSLTKKLYRVAAPDGSAAAKNKFGAIEFLGKGQQTVLPPSLHPDTHDEYVWLTDPIGAPQALPYIDSHTLDELELIARRSDVKLFMLNDMAFLGRGKGGNAHDTLLHATAAMVERGWTDEQIEARVRLAIKQMLARSPVPDEWDDREAMRRVKEMVESARKKGYDQPKAKRRVTKADQRVAALQSFVEQYGGMDMFWNDRGSLRHYEDGVWNIVDDDRIRHKIHHFIIPMGGFDHSDIESVLNLLYSGARNYDRGPSHLIGMQNAVLNIKDNVLLPHSPDHHLISKAPFDYDPHATCPTYEAFIHGFFNRPPDPEKGIPEPTEDEIQRAIGCYEEFMGLSLIPDSRFEKALIMRGQPGSGKSTIMNLSTQFHSTEATSAVSLSRIQDDRYSWPLKDTLLNVTAEMSTNTWVDEEVFKKFVSGDLHDFRQMRENTVKARCTARFLVVCNELFKIRDPSGAVERRMIILETGRPVPEEGRDINLYSKLQAELPGIFNRFVAAYKNLVERGRFDPPNYVKQELKAFTEANSPVFMWYQERTNEGHKKHMDPDHRLPTTHDCTPSTELYVDYVQWAEMNGQKPMNNVNWGSVLVQMGFPARLKRVGGAVTRARPLTLLSVSQGKDF